MNKQQTKNIQDVVADKVDVAVYNLLFAGLSIEQMDKIPKWLLENMEKNKEDVKTTLTQLVKEVEAGERGRCDKRILKEAQAHVTRKIAHGKAMYEKGKKERD